MNKNFFIGFFFCFFLWTLVAFAPMNNKFDKERAIYDDLQNIYLNVQPKQYRIFKSTPNAIDLKEREIVLVSTGAKFLYTKIDSIRYFVSLSSR